MPFLRAPEYFVARFHRAQEVAWLGYKAGKDVVLDWGRRTGKSDLISELFIEDIEDHGKDCLYGALTQDQARSIMWPKLWAKLSDNPNWKPHEQRLEWKYLPTNATLSLRGLDLGKDRLRGNAKRLIALDELAFARDPSIIKEVLAPQLVDYNGQFIFASTPKGKNHFWLLKQAALSDSRRFYTSHCTMFDNPFISSQGRDKILQEYTGPDDPLYRQEVMAEYVDFFGLVFALPPDSYIEDRWPGGDMEHSFHWRGVDHGFSPDPTACVWVAYNKRKDYFQVYSEYKQPKLLIHQHTEVIQKQEPYKIQDTISDIDPQLIAEYDAIGLSMTPAGKYDKESRLLRIVNALKTGKLKIARNCTELLREMQTYEWDQDGNDHLCFAAGTKIHTEDGVKNIEEISTSDRVLTRDGFKNVLAAQRTGIRRTIKLRFTNNTSIVCTPDHPFWVKGKGFVPSDALTYEDRLFTSDECQMRRPSDLTASYIDDTPIQNEKVTGCISEKTGEPYTETSGNSIMVPFQRGITFIIKTGTLLITSCRTSSAFLKRTILKNTHQNGPKEADLKNKYSYLIRLGLCQLNGIEVLRAGNGINAMLKKLLKKWQPRLPRSLADYAVRFLGSFNLLPIKPSYAQGNVEPKIEEIPVKITSKENVACVRGPSLPVGSANKTTAVKDAVGLLAKSGYKKVPVYNLTVEDNHEYFANGILVSNCDALNYAFTNLTVPEDRKEESSTRQKKEVLNFDYSSFDYGQDFGD